MRDLLYILLGLAGLFFVFLIIKALIAGISLGRMERKQGLENPQPITWMLRLNMFEPIITVISLIISTNRFTNRATFFMPSLIGPFLDRLPWPIISALSLLGLLIILPLGWSFSRNRATRRVSHRLLWIGVWRVFWVFAAFQTYGLAAIIGVFVLARSISSVRELAFDNDISVIITKSNPFSLYQPITMGPEGLMVGIVQGDRFTRERNMNDRDEISTNDTD